MTTTESNEFYVTNVPDPTNRREPCARRLINMSHPLPLIQQVPSLLHLLRFASPNSFNTTLYSFLIKAHSGTSLSPQSLTPYFHILITTPLNSTLLFLLPLFDSLSNILHPLLTE